MPKETFHCGNAISSIVADIISRYNKIWKGESESYSVLLPWNLHGLPYEKMFFERYGYVGDYIAIRDFAIEYVGVAEQQAQYFLGAPQNIFPHCDTDNSFLEFTQECFLKLIEKKYIVLYNGDWFIDTNSLLKRYNIDLELKAIQCYPNYRLSSIIHQKNTFDGLYPISKKRIFTAVVCYKGDTITVNPIFQSFIYTTYLAMCFHERSVAFQIGGAGFSMLKWQYFRQLISLALTGHISVDNLVLHGTILGSDGKPMSKHRNNTLQPSEIYEEFKDKNLVRYTLIRSISNNDIPIQIEKSVNEFKRIFPKLQQIEMGILKPIKNGSEYLLSEVIIYLSGSKFSAALETYYRYLKEVILSENGDADILNMIKKINNIFFVENFNKR